MNVDAEKLERQIGGGDCLSFECPNCHTKLLVAVEPEEEHSPKGGIDKLADFIANFRDDQQLLLNFSDEGDHYKISPKNYLGSEKFAEIGAVVRKLGGEYVSQGKESHFIVKKSQGGL